MLLLNIGIRSFLVTNIFWIQIILAHLYGAILPVSHILIEEGGSFTLTCQIKEGIFKYDSSSLGFYDNNDTKMDHVILNKTNILMKVSNATIGYKLYTCKFDNNEGVDQKIVIVEYPLRIMENFQCRSFEFGPFVCTFDPFESITNWIFTLDYKECDYASQNCGKWKSTTVNNSEAITDMIADCSHTYKFILNIENRLSQNLTVKGIESVILDTPNIKINNISTNSAVLSWEKYLPKSCQSNVKYDVELLIEGIVHEIKDVAEYEEKSHKITLKLIKLNSFIKYTIGIRQKINGLSNDMWSEFGTISFQTLPSIPSTSPKIDIGGFENINGSSVAIFFEPIEKDQNNGANLTYVVGVKENGRSM